MRSKLFIGYLLTIIVIASCSNPKVTISGTITNMDGQLIDLVTADTSYQINVDSTGVFDGSIELKEATYVSMNYSGRFNTLFLEPGDELSMSFDPDKMQETLTYQGKGEVANSYLNLIRSERNKLPTDDELMILEEQPFLDLLDSTFKRLNDLLTLNQSQLNSKFYKMEQAKLDYSKAEMLVRYPSYHQYLIQDESFSVSPPYFELIKQFELNKPELVGIYQFESFINGMIQLNIDHLELSSTAEEYRKSFELVNELISDEIVRTLGYSKTFYNYLSTGISYDQAFPLYEQYGINLSKSDKEVFDEVLSRLKKVQPGNPSPKFEFSSMYGDLVSSDVLKGKTLFITIWSSADSDYLLDLNKSIELQNRYGKEIQFIYVSIDHDFTEWQLLVRELDLPDIQLFATEGWLDPFLQQYVIEKIPRHIMVDQNGNVIDAFIMIEDAEQSIQKTISQLSS